MQKSEQHQNTKYMNIKKDQEKYEKKKRLQEFK